MVKPVLKMQIESNILYIIAFASRCRISENDN